MGNHLVDGTGQDGTTRCHGGTGRDGIGERVGNIVGKSVGNIVGTSVEKYGRETLSGMVGNTMGTGAGDNG